MMSKKLKVIYRAAITGGMLAWGVILNLSTAYACGSGSVEVSGVLGTGSCVGGPSRNPIFAVLSTLINFFSAIIGLILVLVLVIAGIEYIVSRGNSEGTKDAKNHIKAAVTGFLLFVLMYGILQVILPKSVRIFS